MADTAPPVASIVRLGTKKLLIVEIDDPRNLDRWKVELAIHPDVGGGDDWCIIQGSSCDNLGPHCSGMTVTVPPI